MTEPTEPKNFEEAMEAMEIKPTEYVPIPVLDTCQFYIDQGIQVPEGISKTEDGQHIIIELDPPVTDVETLNITWDQVVDDNKRRNGLFARNGSTSRQETALIYLEKLLWIIYPTWSTGERYSDLLKVNPGDPGYAELGDTVRNACAIRYRYAKLCHEQGKQYGEIEITEEILEQIRKN